MNAVPAATAPRHMFDVLLDRARRVVTFDGHAVTGLARLDRGVGTGTVLRSSWPQSVRDAMIDRRLYLLSPTAHLLKRHERTVTNHDVAALVAGEPEMARVETLLADAAGQHLVSVPIRHEGRLIGATSFRRGSGAFEQEELDFLELVAPALHAAAAAAPGSELPAILTPREREVMLRVSHGKTSWEIAIELAIAQRTVDAHVTSSTLKLGAGSRAHAVAEALRRGLIQ